MSKEASMQFIKDRFNYLFKSTKGLILVAIAMIGLETAIFGMLSGPMAELGVQRTGDPRPGDETRSG